MKYSTTELGWLQRQNILQSIMYLGRRQGMLRETWRSMEGQFQKSTNYEKSKRKSLSHQLVVKQQGIVQHIPLQVIRPSSKSPQIQRSNNREGVHRKTPSCHLPLTLQSIVPRSPLPVLWWSPQSPKIQPSLTQRTLPCLLLVTQEGIVRNIPLPGLQSCQRRSPKVAPSPHLVQVLRMTLPCFQLATQQSIIQQCPLLGLRPSPRSPKVAVKGSDNIQIKSPPILYNKCDSLSCMALYIYPHYMFLQYTAYPAQICSLTMQGPYPMYVCTACEWTLVHIWSFTAKEAVSFLEHM